MIHYLVYRIGEDMKEFEPKLKKKIFTKEFFSKYIYIFVIALCLLLGVSYSLTFFVQNENITTGNISTGELTINFTDRNINVSGMLPSSDDEGLFLYAKKLTITNNTNIDGKVKLTLTRTSGLNLTDMRYALIVNGAIQVIDDIPQSGEILSTAIMGGSPTGEQIKVEIRIWPKSSYAGNETSFVGTITPEIKYFGSKASGISSPTGKYVNFNCNGSNCEVWRIVKVENGRLVLTRQADYEGASERSNSNRYYASLSFNDNSLITSVSSDTNHKNVYLLRTVKIYSGSGTQTDPYVLTNDDTLLCEPDQKVIAEIIYKEKSVTSSGNSYVEVSRQNIYFNQVNYISQVLNKQGFVEWQEGTHSYNLGDIVNFNTDKILLADVQPAASEIGFDNTITGFNCDNIQCAIIALYNAKN